jgi:type 1 glutamine amidotransferase
MVAVSSAYLVVGGKYHDMDFARIELLKLLGEHEDIRTRVAEDYRDTEAIAEADFLITYTCDVRPSLPEQQALAKFVAGGGRWFALHGTNAVLVVQKNFTMDTPRDYPVYMETLGSQFMSHPPVAPYPVSVADPHHPLVAGIEPFEATDELYLCDYHGKIVPLLETHFTGDSPGFSEEHWPDDDARLVMYLHPVEAGEVLYLTLGHCRGKYDMRPLIDEYPTVERCSWDLPVFYELLRRGITWAKSPRSAE